MDLDNDEAVNLLIRCALQSFDDLSISCPSSWTVHQLKQKLAHDCPSKPDVKRQRLIYAGHCLHDDHTLKSVFELRPIDDGSIHVIHLVCPPKNFSAFNDTPMIRRRNVNQTQANAGSLGSATTVGSQTTNPNINSYPFYTNPLWTNAFPTLQAMPASTDAQFQSAYQIYITSYSNYMYQVMSALSNNPNGIPPQQLLNSHQTLLSNITQQTQQFNQPQQAFVPDANLAAAPAAGGIVQEPMAGGVEVPQRDFLDVVYKAIRMCFLIMLVYVYSSAERFFGVLLFILVAWFLQARRDRNNRERADRELAAAVNNVRQPQQVDEEQEVNHAVDNQTVAEEVNETETREPTAWVVFWSTCYTFITSFFSSLIPDNPVPVNIN